MDDRFFDKLFIIALIMMVWIGTGYSLVSRIFIEYPHIYPEWSILTTKLFFLMAIISAFIAQRVRPWLGNKAFSTILNNTISCVACIVVPPLLMPDLEEAWISTVLTFVPLLLMFSSVVIPWLPQKMWGLKINEK